MVVVESASTPLSGQAGTFVKVRQKDSGMTAFVPDTQWHKKLRRPLAKEIIEDSLQTLRGELKEKRYLKDRATPADIFLGLAKEDADFSAYTRLLREIYSIPRKDRSLRVQMTLSSLEIFLLSEIAYVYGSTVIELRKEFDDLYGKAALY
jgi:hypothetical protein